MKLSYVYPVALGAVILVLVGAYLINALSVKAPTADSIPTEAQQEAVQETETQVNVKPRTTTTSPKPTVPVAPASNPAPSANPAPVASGEKTFTMAEVKIHASASSCYTVVRGAVYDVTSWINKHPGGSNAILSMCGTDATDAFESQHGGQRRPEAELASFKIGVLK